MRHITITLNDTMYAELETVAAGTPDLTFSPATWAQEAVEAALASRRLPAISRLTADEVFGRKPEEMDL